MPQFGRISLQKLSNCHVDLQKLFNEVIKNYDCIILEGYRSNQDQLKAFENGKSKIKSGGKHNQLPSLAVDVVPYPVDFNDHQRFYYFAGRVLGIAQMLKIKIRWGGDWDIDHDLKDQSFYDLAHFELAAYEE